MASNVAPLTKGNLIEQSSARGNGRSQATVIEQSRAIAEVQGALLVADRRPRDRQRALSEAMESCRTQEVAQTAFFKFPRGGQSVSGPSIHLARELARCWGNLIYAVVELDRDDDRALSEMMAYCWDLETNTRSQTQFLVPHKRDKKGGAETLTDMRDIYENNANMGARRLRECIFAVLPPYLSKAAEEQCRVTLEQGEGDQPLPVRINQGIEAFAKIGIDKKRIEARMGPVARFSAVDLANMQISYQSIRRGEVSADDEYPKVAGLTGEMITSGSPASVSGHQTTGEAIGDSIPALDEEAMRTLHAIDGPLYPEPEQAAEDEAPAWAEPVERVRKGIAAAEDLAYLKGVEGGFLKIRVGLPDEVIQEIEAAIKAKRNALRAASKGAGE